MDIEAETATGESEKATEENITVEEDIATEELTRDREEGKPRLAVFRHHETGRC